MMYLSFIKKSFFALFFAFLAFFTFPCLAQQTIIKTLQHDGLTRNYRLYIPQIYNAQKPVPLIINLHGFTSNEVQQEFYGDFRGIADTANFIIAHPRGTALANGNLFWNVGFVPSTVDDLGFLDNLIDTIAANYSIDPQRIYATGMSNGGFMSYSLACINHRFAAIASVTGSMTVNAKVLCKPPKPIPVLEIHGTADAVVPYVGSALFSPIDSVVKYWVKFNGCSLTPSIADVPNTNITDGASATHYIYKGGKNGTSVELFKVTDGAHTWPGAIIPVGTTCMDFSASKEIWRFFRQNKYLLNTEEEKTLSKLDFDIFPNPSEEKITLTPLDDSNGFSKIQILDLQGNICFEKQQTVDSSISLDIAQLPKGFYFLKLKNEKGLGLKKFLKM